MNSQKNMKQRPFGMRDKTGYLFGNLANDFTFQFATGYLLVFYTKVLGIGAGFVGTLFLLAKLFDAFTDVTMGNLCDKSKPTEQGKFLPWIRRFCIPLVLANTLMFNCFIADLPMGFKMTYVVITYILYGSICYTGVNIPYGSMASVITSDATERASLSSFRSIGAIVPGVSIGVIAPMIVYTKDAAQNEIANGERFFLASIILGVGALICYVIFFKCSVERVKLPEVQKTSDNSIKEDLRFLVKDRAFLSVITVALFTLIGSYTGLSLNQYLFLDYFGDTQLMRLVMLVRTVGMFLIAPFTEKITKRFGKKEAGSVALAVVAVFYLAIYVVRVKNPAVYIGLQFILNIALGYFTLVSWAYLTDVIDHYQVKTGKRKDGTVFAVYSFVRKLGQAVAGAVGGWTLALIGYNSSAVVQTTEIKNSIFTVSMGIPAVCYGVSALLLFMVYPLTKEMVAKNQEAVK